MARPSGPAMLLNYSVINCGECGVLFAADIQEVKYCPQCTANDLTEIEGDYDVFPQMKEHAEPRTVENNEA